MKIQLYEALRNCKRELSHKPITKNIYIQTVILKTVKGKEGNQSMNQFVKLEINFNALTT